MAVLKYDGTINDVYVTTKYFLNSYPLVVVGMGDGTVVKTDKGNMVAYNISSLPHFTQAGSNLRNKTLHNIVSKFGTAVSCEVDIALPFR